MSEKALALIQKNLQQEKDGDPACKRLDIGNCGLTEIPEEVFELVWLEELVVSNTWDKPKFDFHISESEDNLVERNCLDRLPPKLSNLINLKHLKVGGYWAGDDWAISKLANLPDSLISLDIRNNLIGRIENLTSNLITVNLSDNKIFKLENLPDGLKSLNVSDNKIELLENLPKGLLELNIYSNRIAKLENLPVSLIFLSIWKNKLSEIENLPEGLAQLIIGENEITRLENLPAGLTQLDIRSNQITQLENLPDGLKQLDVGENEIRRIESLPTKLTKLGISGCQITKLENLPDCLTQLDINRNQITQLENLPDCLKKLEIVGNKILRLENLPDGLTQLNIDFNQITQLEKLPSILKRLYIGYNQITRLENLPDGLTQLVISSNQITQLENLPDCLIQLGISSNQITQLENLPPSLRIIDIRYNKIENLTPLKVWVGNSGYRLIWNNLPKDNEIAVGDNPLTTPPPEIAKRGNDAVLEYFRKLEENRIKLYESKLLIVGQGEVGKTWLMHSLITGKTPEDGKTTDGIDIRSWHFDSQDIKDFRVNFWDFGGQEIYHATHQFFLTKRSLYLFVWDARKEQDIITSFDYWLNVISLLSRQSPVIVVMNKCDERTKAIEEETLKKRFGNIIAFHKVSALDGTGIEALKTDLVKHITSLPQVGTELPKVWNDIRRELEGSGNNSISLKEYNEICGGHGLNPTEAEFIGDYYHDLGVFLHFRANAILRDIIFLNPEWATTAVYKIIDTKDVQKAFGHFDYGKLKEIWQEYDEDKYKYLLALMKRFELCYQIGNSEKYIVPELLRPEYPELKWDYAENLRFELRYDFMPAGIVTRLITRRNHQIKDGICWRNGLVIERNNSEALIISDSINRKISIWIRGDERKEMLFLIRDEIDQIHETLNFPAFKAMYPCICSECKASETPHFFDSGVLVNFMLKNKPTAECQKSGEDVNIEELRGSIMSNTDFAYDAILAIVRSNQETLHQVIEMLTVIKSNQPDKDTVLDEFFKIIPMDFGVINFGELLKKLLRFRKERLDFRND